MPPILHPHVCPMLNPRTPASRSWRPCPVPITRRFRQRQNQLADVYFHRRHCCCKAQAPDSESDALSLKIPSSRKESILQACDALSLLQSAAPLKGFSSRGQARSVIEIPVADESINSAVQLAEDLLDGLPALQSSNCDVIFSDIEAALSASGKLQNAVHFLDDVDTKALGQFVLIINPMTSQIPALEAMLKRWRGKAAVLVNPEWRGDAKAVKGHASFAKSFQTAYCFEPILIQAFLSRTEGAILRSASQADLWYIYKREWGKHKLVGRVQRRPTPEDLEFVFYNAAAATSPLVQGVKAVRGLATRKKAR